MMDLKFLMSYIFEAKQFFLLFYISSYLFMFFSAHKDGFAGKRVSYEKDFHSLNHSLFYFFALSLLSS